MKRMNDSLGYAVERDGQLGSNDENNNPVDGTGGYCSSSHSVFSYRRGSHCQ